MLKLDKQVIQSSLKKVHHPEVWITGLEDFAVRLEFEREKPKLGVVRK